MKMMHLALHQSGGRPRGNSDIGDRNCHHHTCTVEANWNKTVIKIMHLAYSTEQWEAQGQLWHWKSRSRLASKFEPDKKHWNLQCDIVRNMLHLFCLDMACVVVAISTSNVRIAPGPPTALVNKQGASCSLLFCIHFASTRHVWRWQFQLPMSKLPLGLPPLWWISKVHYFHYYFAFILLRQGMCGGGNFDFQCLNCPWASHRSGE